MGTSLQACARSPRFGVVGIGASAGGIQALQALFRAIPGKPELAFVVVQHLAPNHPSQLAHLMGLWTELPVCEISEGMRFERGFVYVAPPGAAIGLRDGAFVTESLEDADPRVGIDTVDRFFDSLARHCGQDAIAVVLSGTGADGAVGAVRIKQAGGMVLVQEPVTAMHDGMPRAAIANGAADHILPLGALAQELVAAASPDYVRSRSAGPLAEDVMKAVDGIIELIRTRAGFDLTGYKTTPLLWRIQRRMELRGVPLFGDYESLLRDDRAELETLIRSIPIHVTAFFRDAPEWERLRREVIPGLFADRDGEPVRAWTPACATGEEAYSLAMLLSEHAQTLDEAVDFQVFATDVASDVVARASRGVFKPAAVNPLSPERRQRFFYASDGVYRVKRALREKMVFAPQDLLSDPPFTGLDIVTCRNLLIYLEPDAAGHVLYLLHTALRVGGYLFLGSGESLPAKQRGFQPLSPGARIYRKLGEAAGVEFRFPKRVPRLRAPGSSESAVEAHAHHATVEQHELPAVLVDEQFQMVRLYGDTAPFLRLKPGEPTLNLLSVLGPGLGVSVERAAREALSQRRAVSVSVPTDPKGGGLAFGLRLTPLDTPEQGGSRVLITFLPSAPAAGGGAGAASLGAAPPEEADDYREQLRLSNEELDASREELQALNEQLRASNDQLNLVNDDLAAANAQLRSKLEELETQSNVLSSGAVMTLFVDRELRVRWFTPALRELFPLRPGDVGRPLTDVVQLFDDERFIADIRAVMDGAALREAEVPSTEDKWFLRRIRPYLDNAAAAAGVAITFSDISELKRAEEALRESEATKAFLLGLSDALRPLGDALEIQAQAARVLGEYLRVTRVAYGEISEDGEYVVIERSYVAPGATPLEGRFAISAFGRVAFDALVQGQSFHFSDVRRAPRLEAHERAAYERAGVRALVVVPLIKAGRLVSTLSLQHERARAWSAKEIALVELTAERTWAGVQRTRAEAALRESEARFRALAQTAPLGVVVGSEGTLLYCNAAFEVSLGYEPGTLHGHSVMDFYCDPADRDALYAAMREQGSVSDRELRLRRKDGSGVWHSVSIAPIEFGGRQAVIGVTHDVTERRRAAAALAESDQRMRLALRAARMVSWEWFPAEDRTLTSDGLASLYGLRAPVGARVAASLVLAEDAPAHFAKLDRVATGGGSYTSEYRVRRLDDGHVVWLEERGEALLDADGSVERVIGVTLDITRRKRTEEALRDNERRLQATQENVGVGIQEVDAEGRYLRMNGTFERMSGYTLADFAGRSIFDAVADAEAQAAARRQHARLIRGEIDSYDEERTERTKAGRRVWTQVHTTAVRDEQGQFLYAVRVIHDVTVRRAAEEALRESEARARLAVEISQLASWDWDLASGAVRWNDAHYRMLGYAVGEVTPGYATWLARVHPEDREPTVAALQAARERRAPYVHEFRTLHPDGSLSWVSARGTFLLDERGAPCRMIGVMEEITTRKRAEELMRHLLEMRAVGILFFELDGSICDANDALLEMLGLAREELARRGLRLDELTPDEWRARNQEILAQLRATGECPPCETEYLRRDGSRLHACCACKLLADGKALGFVFELGPRATCGAAAASE